MVAVICHNIFLIKTLLSWWEAGQKVDLVCILLLLKLLLLLLLLLENCACPQ